MNYLAHGYRFTNSPLMLAGTAVPDWLCVVDRQVRVRSRIVNERLGGLSPAGREVAAGILQHLQDDDRFHRCPGFLALESELSVRFRSVMTDPFDHRPPFLGHILVELLLDSVITERSPAVLAEYYRSLETIEAGEIEQVVNLLARKPTTRLAGFIEAFRSTQFLYDYRDDGRLMYRLNQVLRRVTLPPLDDGSLPILRDARRLLRKHADELLFWVEQPGAGTAEPPATRMKAG